MRSLTVSIVVFFLLLAGAANVQAATIITGSTTHQFSRLLSLNESITDSNATVFIDITASDVILDGQGYTIDGEDGSNTYGVYVYNSSITLTNVTVKNLVVTDWERGIYYKNTENGNITSNTIISNNNYGISLYSSNNNTNTCNNTGETAGL